ncbi:hypothetical protein ABG067_002534 [Albugo candida]|uniref:RNA 3'-terminal phosphate cyclase domain-containing protein n=1 Tax=Albugo candida TaxID=65357 RepID=A0A024G202_9STRA|nr:unnamed protein product [Albugo candida]|eukprot:CCI40333.1 unnamed protein product [Albugo candida]
MTLNAIEVQAPKMQEIQAPSESKKRSSIRLKGCTHFRQRLVCATLTGKRLILEEIRADEEEPGLTDFEASFLRLLDTITNGSHIEINETGTRLKYRPGFIIGGSFEHDCGQKRSIGWFLEALVALAPFGKLPVRAVLRGVTNDNTDISVDSFKATTIPTLKHFGISDELNLTIKKRGAPPLGGGEIIFSCPLIRQLQSIYLVEEGFIKRIRGTAYSTRVSPQTSNRIVECCRGVFNKLLPDVYIYSDHYKGAESGQSPGFALSLVAETTSGILLGADGAASAGDLPEDVATIASHALCEEIKQGGCIDSTNQSLVLLFMALSPPSVSKVRVGRLTPYTIQYMRHIRDFLGVTFKIAPDRATKTVFLSCSGLGFQNLSKKVT